MEETKKPNVGQEKMSYDELKKMASDLYADNQKLSRHVEQLTNQLNQFDTTSFILSMLFKVMDHPNQYDKPFLAWVKANIQSTLTAMLTPEPEEEKKTQDEAE
jgi:arsenate reductase-like glutaredoxin family protein